MRRRCWEGVLASVASSGTCNYGTFVDLLEIHWEKIVGLSLASRDTTWFHLRPDEEHPLAPFERPRWLT